MAGVLGALLAPVRAYGCPMLRSLIDFNCDQQERISITGDSIVAGVGDTKNNNRGGYVKRLRISLPGTTVTNLGVPGITSLQLLTAFKRNLLNEIGETTMKSRESDVMIIAVGTNDYFDHRPASFTVRNIRRLVHVLRSELAKYSQAPPFVAVALLTPTNRSFQQPFVAEVNKLLIEQSSSALPVYIPFNELDPTLLSIDGLHPTAAGYDALAQILQNFLEGQAEEQMSKRRPDIDQDGVYDLFETKVFGTDPSVADTDGDGLADGIEIFENMSDPLNSAG